MRHSFKHDSTCWVRFGMYGAEKCYGCAFEQECDLEPEDNPYAIIRANRAHRVPVGISIQDRIDIVLADIKKKQKQFTPSAITDKVRITRRAAAEYLKQRDNVRIVKVGKNHHESVWEFI